MEDSITSVKYAHYRIPASYQIGKKHSAPDSLLTVYHRSEPNFEPHSKGGRTVCVVTMQSGTVFSAHADCSLADNFNYKRGREISFGRVLKMLETIKKEA